MKSTTPSSIDEYIDRYPKSVQAILEHVRHTVQKAAPGAQEAIRYQMPTFRLNGKNLVYFAAFQHHIGFYPVPTGITAFKKELSRFKQGKGSVQFPLDEPIPYDLISRIVAFRVKELTEKTKGSTESMTQEKT